MAARLLSLALCLSAPVSAHVLQLRNNPPSTCTNDDCLSKLADSRRGAEAKQFCTKYLSPTGCPLPSWFSSYSSQSSRISSACICLLTTTSASPTGSPASTCPKPTTVTATTTKTTTAAGGGGATVTIPTTVTLPGEEFTTITTKTIPGGTQTTTFTVTGPGGTTTITKIITTASTATATTTVSGALTTIISTVAATTCKSTSVTTSTSVITSAVSTCAVTSTAVITSTVVVTATTTGPGTTTSGCVVGSTGYVTNGGFESGQLTPWQIDPSVPRGNVNTLTVTSGDAHSGNYKLFAQFFQQTTAAPNPDSTIVEQTINLQPGGTYKASVYAKATDTICSYLNGQYQQVTSEYVAPDAPVNTIQIQLFCATSTFAPSITVDDVVITCTG